MRKVIWVFCVAALVAGFAIVAVANVPAPATSFTASANVKPITLRVVHAVDGKVAGIYWRSAPGWNSVIKQEGHGVYNGDEFQPSCYIRGGTVRPSYNNPLWYKGRVVSGRGVGEGFVNDHFLDTGSERTALRSRCKEERP